MDNKVASKIVLLKIWEILNQETDADNHMPSTELLAKLGDIGIPCDRRTLYKYIDVMNEYGYDIHCKRSKNNEYWVDERGFSPSEVRVMLDAIQAASFITPKKTVELVNKVSELAGSLRGEIIKQNTVAFNTKKSSNDQMFDSVAAIGLAIRKKKKILFRYFDYNYKHEKVMRRDGHRYVVNPLATIFSNGQYYLVCYNDVNHNTTHYRIDRMQDVSILEDAPITPRPGGERFSISKHKSSVFGMFGGEAKMVRFEADEKLLDVVFDQFGDDIKIKPTAEGRYTFSAEVQMSSVFLGWVCAFGESIKVVAPEDAVEKVREHIESLTQTYSKND